MHLIQLDIVVQCRWMKNKYGSGTMNRNNHFINSRIICHCWFWHCEQLVLILILIFSFHLVFIVTVCLSVSHCILCCVLLLPVRRINVFICKRFREIWMKMIKTTENNCYLFIYTSKDRSCSLISSTSLTGTATRCCRTPKHFYSPCVVRRAHAAARQVRSPLPLLL